MLRHNQSEKHLIYILKDPIDNTVKYVGQTIGPVCRRIEGHNCDRTNTAKYNWIRKLKAYGIKPKIEIIEECDRKKRFEREMFWIEYYNKTGCSLFNIKNGSNPIPDCQYNINKKKLDPRFLELRIGLMEAEISQSEIARRAGVSRQMVNLVIKRKVNSVIVMHEIAKAIGKTVDEVFPTT